MSRLHNQFGVPTWDELAANDQLYKRMLWAAQEDEHILEHFSEQVAQEQAEKAEINRAFFDFSANQWQTQPR
jgi:hypothetical protein